MLALVAAGLLFLRWFPRYGWFPVIMVVLAACAATAVAASQARRHHRSVDAIGKGTTRADPAAVGATAAAVTLLGALALYTVLALPLR